MRMSISLGMLALLSAAGLLAQDARQLPSGPRVGEVLPGPFDAVNITGKNAKGRQHCLVCEYGLNPVVVVFAREPAAGQDGPLMSLLGKLDEEVSRYADDYNLKSFVIFMSADGRNSANTPGEQDTAKIREEALARAALEKRLEERADKLKNVVVGYVLADGPKDYKINAKAEVTVLFYQRHKVLANFAYAAGQMTQADVGKMIKTIDGLAKNK